MRLDGVSKDTKHGHELSQRLKTTLIKNKTMYENELIPELDYINHRAENNTGIDVGMVEHQTGNKYILSYSVDWSIFNGCADMDESGTEKLTVSFTVENDGTIVFDSSAFESRTTTDEF